MTVCNIDEWCGWMYGVREVTGHSFHLQALLSFKPFVTYEHEKKITRQRKENKEIGLRQDFTLWNFYWRKLVSCILGITGNVSQNSDQRQMDHMTS